MLFAIDCAVALFAAVSTVFLRWHLIQHPCFPIVPYGQKSQIGAWNEKERGILTSIDGYVYENSFVCFAAHGAFELLVFDQLANACFAQQVATWENHIDLAWFKAYRAINITRNCQSILHLFWQVVV
ncbi:MAG: hypothetical protein P4L69_03165 [Desulfosporosinus sp.]|nr:hypothetical protein [Desulfosporosinus sp.]